MKEVLKTVVSWFIRCVLHIFWLFPIRQQQVFFSAYSGNQYTCNPRYISEALTAKYPGKLQLVWCWKTSDFPTDHPEITFVKFQSPAYFKKLFTSRVVVLNDLQHCSYLPFRKNQTVIQTWHGCGLYKKVGRDVPGNTTWHDRRLRWTTNSIAYFLSGANRFSEIVIRGAFGYSGEIREIGLPRNDLLLDKDRSLKAAQKVRRWLNVSDDCKLLLYAPTFRQDTSRQQLDIPAVLSACQERFGSEFKLLVRSHYMLSNAANTTVEAIDVTGYPDMQELLCAADVLVSDYSSCIWDFSLTGKPCFLFAQDLPDYRLDRDFYMDITKWPFPLAQDNAELAANIRSFDVDRYAKEVSLHLAELGCSESGQAAESIATDIAHRCGIA